jgi:hypothetical protein
MKTAHSSETLAAIFKSTQCHNPEDHCWDQPNISALWYVTDFHSGGSWFKLKPRNLLFWMWVVFFNIFPMDVWQTTSFQILMLQVNTYTSCTWKKLWLRFLPTMLQVLF